MEAHLANTRIGNAANSMEEPLSAQDESKKPKLRLKNGSEVDAKIAYVDWQMLEAVETREPAHLQALVAIARGDEASVAPEVRAHLREQWLTWFNRDGEMEPVVREVLKSAYRDTPDGSLLVFPFQISTQSDQDIFAKIQREDDQILRRFSRRTDDHGRPR